MKTEYVVEDFEGITPIDLDFALMEKIKDYRSMYHKRLEAAVLLVDGIIKQLPPEDRKRFENED